MPGTGAVQGNYANAVPSPCTTDEIKRWLDSMATADQQVDILPLMLVTRPRTIAPLDGPAQIVYSVFD